MRTTKMLKIAILTPLIIGISLVKFYNPVFAGPVEDFQYTKEITELIAKGDLNSSVLILEKIENKSLKQTMLVRLAGEFIQKGESNSAEPLLEKIEDKRLKQTMLVALTGSYISKGEFSSVEALLEKIEDKPLKDTLAAVAMKGCLDKGEIKNASEFLLLVEDENILTAGFLGLLSEYWSEKGFLGTSWFVLRFTFSGKIFQIKW